MSRSRSVDAYPSAGDREDSPLLGDNDSDDGFKSSPSRRRGPTAEVTPLPRAQLAAIYAIKLIVPVANTQIMPYVNKMIAGFDLPDQRNVGYYTGLLSFSHTAGQFMTIYAWGRLSGRGFLIRCGMHGAEGVCRLDRADAGYRRRHDWTRTLDAVLWRIAQLRNSPDIPIFQ